MRKWPIFLFILITIFSCGKTTQDEIDDAVLSANIELGQSNCQAAIDILETTGRQNTNAKYIKALASAYACRAGYSDVSFYANDISKTATPAPLGGTSLYSTSLGTFQTPLEYDPSFVDLQTAINILLYAGGLSSTTEPTAANRALKFTSGEANDINNFLLYLELVQLGKIFRVYGNANTTTGKKGGGGAGNVCFANYSLTVAAKGTMTAEITSLAALGSACSVSNNVGHSQLSLSLVTSATRQRRMCHGAVLLNGMYDSLNAIVSNLSGSIATSATAITAAKAIAVAALSAGYPGIGSITSTINQANCEDTSIVPQTELEAYYALMMESSIL